MKLKNYLFILLTHYNQLQVFQIFLKLTLLFATQTIIFHGKMKIECCVQCCSTQDNGYNSYLYFQLFTRFLIPIKDAAFPVNADRMTRGKFGCSPKTFLSNFSATAAQHFIPKDLPTPKKYKKIDYFKTNKSSSMIEK